MDSPPGSTARPAGIKAASGPEEPQTKSSQDSKPPDGGEANYLEDSLGSAFKLSLAMAITVPLGIVTKIAVPRYLGEELAGRFFFAENFPTVLLMFLSLGIGVYIQKTLPARREHAVDVFSPVLKLEAAFAAVLIATLVGYMKATGYDLDIICLTGFMACVQAMCVIQNDIIQKVFFAVGLTREVAIVNVVSKVVLASAVLLSLLSGAGVYGLATCFFCAQLIAMSMLLSTARNQEMLGGPFRFPVIRRVLLTGLPFFGTDHNCSVRAADNDGIWSAVIATPMCGCR